MIAGAVALPSLLFATASTDLAAQTFRADLWSEHGWVLWNQAWYSGHLVPGYSLIYPPLGALIGPRLVGLLAAIAMASVFAILVHRLRPGRAATVAAVWFAFGSGALLYTGRVTFMLGFALGLLALLAVRRLPLAALAAALAALASPVAGLFTALAGVAMLLGGRRREGAVLTAASLGATLALVLAFPVGGTQPFEFSAFWFVAVACAVALFVVPPELRILRIGIAIYLTMVVALYFIATPIGSNAPRLGALLLGPIAALTLLERRPRLLALVALPLAYWQIAAPLTDLRNGSGSPSTQASFYAPLLAQLDQRTDGAPVRIEIPATRERWEAAYVAERYSLTGGWLRQLETGDLPLFTEGDLTPAGYRSWLTDHGASYVALPDAVLDYESEEVGQLLRHAHLPFLHEVWSDEEWTLWEVRPRGGGGFVPGQALADGGARVSELGPDEFTVTVPGPGEYLIRMRYSPYFEVTAGSGCVEGSGDDSTLLTVPGSAGPEAVRVQARLSLAGALRRDRSCSG